MVRNELYLKKKNRLQYLHNEIQCLYFNDGYLFHITIFIDHLGRQRSHSIRTK